MRLLVGLHEEATKDSTSDVAWGQKRIRCTPAIHHRYQASRMHAWHSSNAPNRFNDVSVSLEIRYAKTMGIDFPTLQVFFFWRRALAVQRIGSGMGGVGARANAGVPFGSRISVIQRSHQFLVLFGQSV